MTIAEAATALRTRQTSSVELTDECLARIARLNPKLNAFITVLDDKARVTARRLDAEISAGVNRGPLHGIPVAVKDVFATKGTRTTAGSKFFSDNITQYDATVVERLEKAGAVIVGKTNMHELAFGINIQQSVFRCRPQSMGCRTHSRRIERWFRLRGCGRNGVRSSGE